VKIDAPWPWFDNLAVVMDEDAAVLQRLADEFEAAVGGPDVERFFAYGLSSAVIGQQSKNGDSDVPFRTALWLEYLQGYWSGVVMRELFSHFGTARGAVEILPAERRQLGPEDVALVADMVAPMHSALAGTAEDQGRALDEHLRLGFQSSALFGAVYTIGSSCLACTPRRSATSPTISRPMPAGAMLGRCLFLEVEFRDPVPQFLVDARKAHRDLRAAEPERWEAVVGGGEGQTDVRDLWHTAFHQALYNWGCSITASWEWSGPTGRTRLASGEAGTERPPPHPGLSNGPVPRWPSNRGFGWSRKPRRWSKERFSSTRTTT
jgi:hypothetical protein